MISIETGSNLRDYTVLKGILRIDGHRGFGFSFNNKNIFIKGTKFWNNESFTSCVTDSGVNYLEMFTTFNDPLFLAKVRNSFLIVELNIKNAQNQFDPLGHLRLPLHHFFIAYRDAAITTRLSGEQLPVLSTDGWVPVLSIANSEKMGEFNCSLAIGTFKQVQHFKNTKALSNGTLDSNKRLQLVENGIKQNVSPPNTRTNGTLDNSNSNIKRTESFPIFLEIRSARSLPCSQPTKIQAKTSDTQNSNSMICHSAEEPSTYVTFQAYAMQNSPETKVYSTKVVESSSNPTWNESFSILANIDYLINRNKRFVLKLWKKSATMSGSKATDDLMIGYAALDFTIFLSNPSSTIDWFDIVGFGGQVNGQINVKLEPLENLQTIIELRNQCVNHVDNLLDSFESSLNINHLHLSRAIKRKFTELEEISQRLRARLFDVTGYDEFDDDQLEEFEHDLNTIVCEET